MAQDPIGVSVQSSGQAPDGGSAGPKPRSRRLRWTIAIAVVVIVALISAAGIFVLSGAGGAARSLTAGNAPADTLAFLDLRTDLPGDQHQKLADFMTHFPGFKDRAQFDNAFDELLNRITGQISPQLTYTSAFKAWTTGEISIAVTDLGAVSGLLNGGTPQGALVVSLKDRDLAEEWVAGETAKTGVAFVSSEYAGWTIHEAGSGADRVAYAFTDKVFIAGNADAVKAGLDAPAKGSLADNEGYKTAMRSLGGDRVAAFYLNPRALLRSEADTLVGLLGPLGGLFDVSSLEVAAVPAWVAGSVRAESDRLIVEMRVPKTVVMSRDANRESALTHVLPGSTVAVIELRSLSTTAMQVFDSLTGEGATDQQRQLANQVIEALRTIGGIDWIGDSALLATRDGTGYGAGVVIQTPDSRTAADKKALFANLVVLGGASLIPSGLSVAQSEWTHNGLDIARFTVSGQSTTPLTFDIAARGNLLIAGYGDDFMTQMLDTTDATSLASQDGYRRVVGAAGMSNSGFAYVDIAAVVDDLGRAAFGADPSFYDLNYAPYLENLSGAACSAIDGQTVTLRIVVTAK